jgi:hypothetical protein
VARLIRIAAWWLVIIALLAAGYWYGRDYVRRHPQDVPWTALRLDDPIGLFTLRKLAALREQPELCRALLREAHSADAAAPPRSAGPDCGYANGIRLIPAEGEARLAPAGVVASCPVAAALVVFERQVLQPAALEHLGSRAAAIDHAGSYSCRRLYGRSEGEFSEHASANAIDIIGFRLADGRSVSILRDWRSAGPEAVFLEEVRSGACRLFGTVLSPEYNAAHADHLHLDQAARGRTGFSVCR